MSERCVERIGWGGRGFAGRSRCCAVLLLLRDWAVLLLCRAVLSQSKLSLASPLFAAAEAVAGAEEVTPAEPVVVAEVSTVTAPTNSHTTHEPTKSSR